MYPPFLDTHNHGGLCILQVIACDVNVMSMAGHAGDDTTDYYAILDIAKTATSSEIKKGYR